MNVLGLSASRRIWGNTDVLVHAALGGAASEGADTRFLRLADLALEPCQGCMACVFQDRDCVLGDRLPEVVEALRRADAVVLGSPAYVLGATAAVKNLHDRLIRPGMTRELAGKPGVALAAAGVPGWEPFSLPQVSLLFLFLGMPVVDQFVAYAQGPGEVVFDGAALWRAEEAGRALGRGERKYRGEEGVCPVCRFDVVAVGGGTRCLLCDLPGELRDDGGRTRLVPAEGAEPRWSGSRIGRHFRDTVLSSGPRFKARAKEMKRKLKALGLGGDP